MSAAPTILTRLRDRAVARRDPIRSDDVAVLYRRGHVAVTAEGAWAYYALGAHAWTGRPDDVNDQAVIDTAQRLAETTGRRITLHGFHEQFPVDSYRDGLTGQAGARPDDTPGARSFRQLTDGAVTCLRAYRAARARVFLGVRFTDAPIPRELLPEVVGDLDIRITHSAAEKTREALAAVDRVVARPGLAGAPVREETLTWMLDRARYLGHDLASVDVDVPSEPSHAPYAPTTVVHAMHAGVWVERHVRVLRVESLDTEWDTSARMPFLAWLGTRAGVDWTATFDVAAGRDVAKSAELATAIAEDMDEYDAELDRRKDRSLARAIARGEQIIDETTSGDPVRAARAWGQILVAVSGATERDAITAGERLASVALDRQKMTLKARGGQYGAWRRFQPGEPSGDMRDDRLRLPVLTLAAGAPTATSAWGDTVGFPLGPVAGSEVDVAVFDPHGNNAHQKPGSLLIAARQGGTKTSLALALADWDMSFGRPGAAFSPDGMIAQVGKAKHIAPHFRHFPLTEQKHRGVIQPSILVPEPRWQDYAGEEDAEKAHEAACARARADRITRTVDALAWLLPYELVSSNRGAKSALRVAVAAAGGEYGVDPWEHVAALEAEGTAVGREVAALITAAEHTIAGRLTLPDRRRGVDPAVERLVQFGDALCTVVTCPGLTLPQTSDPSLWSDDEYAAAPIIAGGAALSARGLRTNRDPGWWIGDEIDIATGGVGPMNSFLATVLYDIRRYNKLAMVLVKADTAVARIDPQAANLFGSVAVGPMSADTAAPLLGALQLPRDRGWAQRIAGQAPGDFTWRHWNDEVAQVRVSRKWWHPDMVAATDTTPGTIAARITTAAGSW